MPLPQNVRRYRSLETAAKALGVSKTELRHTHYENVIAVIWDRGGGLTKTQILKELEARRQHFNRAVKLHLRVSNYVDCKGRSVQTIDNRWYPVEKT